MNRKTVLQWAKEFHDLYEALAPQEGYTTRPETREFNPDSPNGRLMIKVIGALISPMEDKHGRLQLELDLERISHTQTTRWHQAATAERDAALADAARLKAAHDHQYAVAGTMLRDAEQARRECEKATALLRKLTSDDLLPNWIKSDILEYLNDQDPTVQDR